MGKLFTFDTIILSGEGERHKGSGKALLNGGEMRVKDMQVINFILDTTKTKWMLCVTFARAK